MLQNVAFIKFVLHTNIRRSFPQKAKISFYRPQRSWGKVIFSEACVENSVHRGWACVAKGGVHSGGGHARQGGGGVYGRYYEIRSMSGRDASYWNAFLLSMSPLSVFRALNFLTSHWPAFVHCATASVGFCCVFLVLFVRKLMNTSNTICGTARKQQ